MPRNYRHIQQYEKELLKLKEEGLTVKAIGERYGLTYEQTHEFFKRYNRKRRKLAAGVALKRIKLLFLNLIMDLVVEIFVL